jgi:hypothetical protein
MERGKSGSHILTTDFLLMRYKVVGFGQSTKLQLCVQREINLFALAKHELFHIPGVELVLQFY